MSSSNFFLPGMGGGPGKQSIEKSNELAKKFFGRVFGQPRYKASRRNRTRQTIVHTRWDKAVWDEVRELDHISEGIVDLYTGDPNDGEEGRVNWENAPEAVQDLFYSMYKTAPRFEKERHLHKSVRITKKILEELMSMPEFEQLHEKTSMDPVLTGMATEQFFDPLKEIIKRLEEGSGGGGGEGEGEGEGEGGAISRSNQDRANEEGEGSGGGDGDGGNEGDQPPPDVEDDGDLLDGEDREWHENMDLEVESDDLIEEWSQELEELMNEQGVDRLLNRLVEQVNQDLDEVEALRKSIGLGDGEWKAMDPSQRRALAEKLRSPNMKKLADIVGRMKRFAMGVQATKIIESPEEVYDVELGNDVKRLLRSEYALLATKETAHEFYRKFFDSELFQYKLRGKEKAGKGPIVIAIDKSGSMQGDPFDWAMAVAEALRRICQEQDRDYYAMFFGSNNDRERFDFPKGEADFDKVMTFLSCVANGGTQFDGVLNEALERAKRQFEDEGKERADIVFVTDGCAHLDEDWIRKFNEEREKIGTRVYSVYIGGAHDAHRMERISSGPINLLDEISDKVIPISDLTTEAVRDIFRAV